MRLPLPAAIVVVVLFANLSVAQDATKPDTSHGDKLIAKYFARETARLERDCLAEVKTVADWQTKRDQYRGELFDMLGLHPQPAKTELHGTTTGTVEHPEFIVEKVHFQSRPQLYVTGNLYLPKDRKPDQKVPAILYVCGHGAVKKNGISYGNKTHYQHHGAWFARHGYACLTIDSLQLGEIEALHHGLYREQMWWWPGRGYTPAGVEAWNCIRALDYLQSRPEIDGEKLGVTGRSGGGAYSWWIAALDERIKAAVPVAGITDLRNHVIDGVVSGHCDCMYINNTYQWDYPQVVSLVSPRPLIISNTDRDPIFPLDGVYRTFVSARRIYGLEKAADKIGFNITTGGHVDTQELQTQAFRWFDQHLLGVDRKLSKPAEKFFEVEQLRVFDKLPEDQINTKIQEVFVAAAPTPEVPADKDAWAQQRDASMKNLKEYVFRAWPKDEASNPPVITSTDKRDNLVLNTYRIGSKTTYELELHVLMKDGLQKPELTVLNVLDQEAYDEMLAAIGSKFDKAFTGIDLPPADEKAFHEIEETLINHKWAFAYLAPRGVGRTQWNQADAKHRDILRRFILLGQTHHGMCAFDVRRAAQTLRQIDGVKDSPLWLQSHRQMAGVTLAASLFEPNIARLDLYDLPTTLRDGPYFLNAQRFLDTPALVALAAERSKVVLYNTDESAWQYPQQVVDKLGRDKKQLQLRKVEP